MKMGWTPYCAFLKTGKVPMAGPRPGKSGGGRGAVEAAGQSFVDGGVRDGGVILGTRLGCALRSSVLSGKLFTPPSTVNSKVRREAKRKRMWVCW